MYRYKENSLRYRDSCLGSSPERPQDPGVSHQEDPDRSLSYSSYRPWSPSSLVLWHPPAIFFLHTLLLSVLYCFFLFVCLQITIQTYVTVGKTMDLESQVPVLFTGHVTWASRFAHLMLSFPNWWNGGGVSASGRGAAVLSSGVVCDALGKLDLVF